MRTSHLAIRKRIKNERLQITDEQLFASSEFAAYMTDIVEAATGRYRRKSKVKTYWDASEDAGIACTDNRLIVINAGNQLTQSFPSRSLRADSLMGLAGHEAGHILFTDFTMLNLYQSALTSGRFYPEEPENLSPLHHINLDEIKECFNSRDIGAINALSTIASSLTNTMEDLYIEARMMDAFPGSFRNGILLNSLRFAEDIPTVSQQVAENNHDVIIIVNLIIQYAKSGDINNLDGYKGKHLDALYECIPYIDEASYDDDSKARYTAANNMLVILWPFMQSLIDQYREDEQNGTGHATEDLKEQLASSSSPSFGKGKPAASKSSFKHDPASDDDARQQIQEALEFETGRLELEKTEAFDEGESGGTTYDRTFAGSGYVSSAEADMQRILTQLAEEQVYLNHEEELSEELQTEATRISYGNAHKGIHVTVNRMSYVPDTYKESFRRVIPPLLLISKRLQKQVAQILKDAKEGGKLDGLPMGRRINARNLVRNDGRIFYKLKLPGDNTDIAICLLIDESGSMSSCDRITKARSAAIIVHDFCKSLDIPVAIYGHTDSDDVELFAYAEYDSIDGNDKYRMMDICARSGNRDGAALRYAAERLLTRPEEIKLLILISDGQPAGNGGYYGTAAEADLRGIKQEYKNKGIILFAAAIGDDKPNIKRIYGDGFLDISDLNKLPVNLGSLIIRYIKLKHAV